MTSFKTSTHRSTASSALRDRHGCAEIPPPVDADWVADHPTEPTTDERDGAVAEPGPEVWYG
jgi:hypothetical protein